MLQVDVHQINRIVENYRTRFARTILPARVGGRPQGRRLADPTSSAGARAVLMFLRNAVPSLALGRRGWGRPQGLSPCSLGGCRARTSGRSEARPHAQGSRLDVHTESFGYVGASRRTYRTVCQHGSPFGAQKKWCIRPPPSAPPPTKYIYLLNVVVRIIFFCRFKSDTSRYGYLEIFQRVPWSLR